MDASGHEGKLMVETPEQVGLEFDLAGIGSRFLAALIDLACMFVFLVVAMVIAVAGLNDSGKVAKKMAENMSRSEAWTAGLSATAQIFLLLSVFLVLWGYYIVCEMVTGGASPGKRALGLRVIRDNGLPIGFAQSLVRNLVRAVDFLPWGYGVGLVAIFASSRAQRLGDLAAGTLVVRMATAHAGQIHPTAAVTTSPGLLTPRERKLVTDFMARRAELSPEVRARLAGTIAAALRARLEREPSQPHDELWLASLLERDSAGLTASWAAGVVARPDGDPRP